MGRYKVPCLHSALHLVVPAPPQHVSLDCLHPHSTSTPVMHDKGHTMVYTITGMILYQQPGETGEISLELLCYLPQFHRSMRTCLYPSHNRKYVQCQYSSTS